MMFLANFYIECSDHVVSRLGFPKHIYEITKTIVDPGDTVQRSPTPLKDAVDAFIDPDNIVANREFGGELVNFTSLYSLRDLDERLSQDISCTFPMSRKISVVNGIENHEYLLARFDLSTYKQFFAKTFQSDELMTKAVSIEETFQAGIENLTRHYPDYESNLLLTGQIQSIHLQVYTRYMDKGRKITRVPSDLDDGFFQVKLLFSKKI